MSETPLLDPQKQSAAKAEMQEEKASQKASKEAAKALLKLQDDRLPGLWSCQKRLLRLCAICLRGRLQKRRNRRRLPPRRRARRPPRLP